MEENLARAFDKFDLSEKEVVGIDLSNEDIQESVRDCSGSLVGRLVGEKVANYTGVKNFTNHAWGYPRKMSVTELGPNLFQFHLESEEEKEKIISGGPWIMDNQILVVKKWMAGCERNPSFFRQAHLWVQMWNLPVHWMSRSAGFKLGKIFKEVREVIIPLGGGKDGRHMKILAEIDVSQPLVRGTTVKLGGEVCWVEFRYERCPDFCYNCGIIGHGDKTCKEGGKLRQKHREEQYGAWMKAGNIMISPLKAWKGQEKEAVGKQLQLTAGGATPNCTDGRQDRKEEGTRVNIQVRKEERENSSCAWEKEKKEQLWSELLAESRIQKEGSRKEDNIQKTKDGSIEQMQKQEQERGDEGLGKDGRSEKRAEGETIPMIIEEGNNMELMPVQNQKAAEVIGKCVERGGKNENQEQGSSTKRGEKRYTKRMPRNNRIPMQDISNKSRIDGQGEKRKWNGKQLDTEPMEEDETQAPKQKTMKLEKTDSMAIGEWEANPAMPPLSK